MFDFYPEIFRRLFFKAKFALFGIGQLRALMLSILGAIFTVIYNCSHCCTSLRLLSIGIRTLSNN